MSARLLTGQECGAGDWFQPASLASEHPASLTAADVSTRVKGWTLSSTVGTGLGFVVERLAKQEDKGCARPVFFDVASREVLYTARLCDDLSGMELRNPRRPAARPSRDP